GGGAAGLAATTDPKAERRRDGPDRGGRGGARPGRSGALTTPKEDEMRICLASIHPRALSGQIDGLVGLARELGRRGHRVRVVSAFAEDALLGHDRLGLAGGDRGALLPKLARIRRIERALERSAGDADVIQLNLPTPAFSALADLLQWRVDVP